MMAAFVMFFQLGGHSLHHAYSTAYTQRQCTLELFICVDRLVPATWAL